MRKLILIVFLFPLFLFGQNIDSLKLALKNAKNDTARCFILNALIEAENDDAIWPKYNEELLTLTETKLKTIKQTNSEYKIYQKHLADALNNRGYLAQQQGDIPKALDYYSRSLKIREILRDKKKLAESFNNIGVLYDNQDEFEKALEYHRRSLQIREEIGDKQGVTNSLNNIGFIYQTQGVFPKVSASKSDSLQKIALLYYKRNLNIQQEIGDKKGFGYTLNNIGGIYDNQASKYVVASLTIADSLRRLALNYFNQSLLIQEELNYKEGIAQSSHNIGAVYFKLKNYSKAIEFCSQSMRVSKEIGFPEDIKNAARLLCDIYKASGNHKQAIENYELYIQMRDSINNIETQKATIRQQTQYEYDKKKAVEDGKHAIELKAQEDKAHADKKRQYIIIGAVSVILILVAIFSVLLFNRFKTTQKQKQIIEEKQKEILDSIEYAKRIQLAQIPSEKRVSQIISKLKR